MGNISRHFDREEFRCKGTNCGANGGNCGFSAVDVELLEALEDVREHFNQPVTINSGCRCEAHNKAVGGEVRSKHTQGIAADFTVRGVSPAKVHQYLVGKYPNEYGIGLYKTWVHLDVRGEKARWEK